MKLDLVVRRVTSQEAEEGGPALTSVKFRYEGLLPTKRAAEHAKGVMFVEELSYIYTGPPRHKVGDKMSIAVEEVPGG